MTQTAMASHDPWVGSWRPHRPLGPITAMYNSPGPKYSLPRLTGNKAHCLTKTKAPSYSFGTCHKLRTSSLSPGPKYLMPSNITRLGRDGTPAFSLYGRPKDCKIFQTPGPGPASYQLPEVIGAKTLLASSAPMYSLCGRSKTGGFAEDLKKTPGPAAYRVVDASLYKEKPPHFSMTGRNFPPGETNKNQTPGPAAYRVVDASLYKEKPPHFSMTGRNFPPGETNKNPGPGAYRPEMVTSTNAKAPSFSFGLRHSEYIAPLIMDESE